MANRYSKRKQRKMEPVPALTTVIVLLVVIFIGIDVATSGGSNTGTYYLLRMEMTSDVHNNLNGTLTYEIADGIYEQLSYITALPAFTEKYYWGSYELSFDGEGVSFGPIQISVRSGGIVYEGSQNGITIRIDAVEG